MITKNAKINVRCSEKPKTKVWKSFLNVNYCLEKQTGIYGKVQKENWEDYKSFEKFIEYRVEVSSGKLKEINQSKHALEIREKKKSALAVEVSWEISKQKLK